MMNCEAEFGIPDYIDNMELRICNREFAIKQQAASKGTNGIVMGSCLCDAGTEIATRSGVHIIPYRG